MEVSEWEAETDIEPDKPEHGNKRPETLADERPGWGWLDSNGDVWFADDDKSVMCIDGGLIRVLFCRAREVTIDPDWTPASQVRVNIVKQPDAGRK